MEVPDKKAGQHETGHDIEQIDAVHGYMEPIKDRMATSRLKDPFAGEEGSQVQYRIMKWCDDCPVNLIRSSFTSLVNGNLGICSIYFKLLLFIPRLLIKGLVIRGCILILGLGALTTYTGYVLGQFKIRYPQIHNMSDAAEILFGAWGREIVTAAQILFFIFLMGAHILTFSIMMNTLTDHGACTILFCLTSARSFIFGMDIAYSINQPTLLNGFSASLNIVLSFAGHLAFFSFQSELAEPKDFTKALISLQVIDTSLYLVAALVIYYYTGADVKSPAILSASPVVAKISFGIAVGTIIIAGVIIAHVGAKTIYVRLFRGTNRMNEYSLVSYGSWVLIVLTLWTVAWIIANAIPVFNDILELLAAAFASWFSFGLEGLFWLHMNRGKLVSKRKIALAIFNILLVLIACLICGMGLWATAEDISISVKNTHGAFSCADNK
ncbi:hypothetical protein N7540_007051 [Penicillium herquei]|nr:hypothetical protein N7540_007051 [Penicillium herquei]